MLGILALLAPLALVACAGGKDTDVASAGDTDVSDTETDTDTDVADTDTGLPVAPTIATADAWCYHHTTGDEKWIWIAAVTAHDPQGDDTLAPVVSGIQVQRDGVVVATYDLACGTDGACTGQWEEGQDGILCSEATSYRIRFVVDDLAGHESVPVVVTGRQADGPEG